jgi:ACT domain-containing protein
MQDKTYFEVEEILSDADVLQGKDSLIKKEDVKDKADAVAKHALSKDSLTGKKYRAYFHVCRHGVDGCNESCSREIIAETK